MTEKTIAQPAVTFGLPIDPKTADLFAALLPRLDEAQPGDIVGLSSIAFRIGNSIETNAASFIVMRPDGGFDEKSAEDIAPEQYAVVYPLLARFAHSDLDKILLGIDLSESGEDGWYLLSLSIFNRAVMITDTIHDLAPDYPSDLAPNTMLWLSTATSAHQALGLQPFADAMLRFYERSTLIDGLYEKYQYAPVSIPFRPEAA